MKLSARISRTLGASSRTINMHARKTPTESLHDELKAEQKDGMTNVGKATAYGAAGLAVLGLTGGGVIPMMIGCALLGEACRNLVHARNNLGYANAYSKEMRIRNVAQGGPGMKPGGCDGPG